MYAYLAPTYVSAKNIVWRDPNMLSKYLPISRVLRKNESELYIEFDNGSILKILGADKPDALRGSDWCGVGLDEFALQKREIWEEILRPIIAQDDKRWAIFAFTPKGVNYAHELWVKSKEWDGWIQSMLKGSQSGLLEEDQLIQAKKEMTDALYNQEIECFPKGTDIITVDSVKDISDVNIGDFVLGHSNRYRKVLKAISREYSGELIKIYTFGNNKPIICTPEHPIRICNDKVNHIWKKAVDIVKTDRLLFPRPLEGKNKIISEELATIIAWFIAEGSYCKSAVYFSLGKNEDAYKDEIVRCLGKLTSNKITIKRCNGVISIIVSDNELGEFLITNCGSGALNKRISFSLIKGYERLVYDILIKGDGCNVTSNYDSFTTISKTLAYQMQLLAHIIGFTSGISIDMKQYSGFIQGRKVNTHLYHDVRINKTPEKITGATKLRKHKYDISATISKIEKIQFNGLVYNFAVQSDNSYTANGRVVHNCSWVSREEKSMITSEMIDALESNIIFWEEEKSVIACDPSEGGDECVIHAIYNTKILETLRLHENDSMIIVGQMVSLGYKHGIKDYAVDDIGIGKGIKDRLAEQGHNVLGIRSSESAFDKEHFYNKRTEMWWYTADAIRRKMIEPIKDFELKGQLVAPKYEVVDSNGKIRLEPKKYTKDLLGRSPDNADAFVYGIYALSLLQDKKRSVEHSAYRPQPFKYVPSVLQKRRSAYAI